MRGCLVLAIVCSLAGARVQAQVRGGATDSVTVRLARLNVRLDSLEAGQCPAADSLPGRIPVPVTGDSVELALRRLEERTARLIAFRCTPPLVAARPDTNPPAVDDLAAIRAAAAAAAGPADSTSGPVQFVSQQRSGSALNPEISATGDIILIARDPGPQSDNAVLREVEVSFQSALDPYSNTKMFLTFSDEEIGVEEAYLYWTGLPGKIRVDVGKIRQQIGDLNRWHSHALPATDYPLVYQRYLGEEGLAGVGVSVYTTLPVSLGGGTHELWIQGTAAESEPLFGGSRQPTVLGRLQNFWQVSRSTFVQFGATGVGGNNRDLDLRSRLVGGDFRVSWRPPNAGTRREFTVRGEGYRLRATEGAVATTRYGAFLSAQFRASRRWVLGARYDWVETPNGLLERDWQVVPNITWWQSEFVYLRLEGRHMHFAGGNQNQLLAQVVWAMGPHKHETY